MERSQGHSLTRASIIFFKPQKEKEREKEVEGGESWGGGVWGWGEGEDGLEGSSKREAVCMGVWRLGN